MAASAKDELGQALTPLLEYGCTPWRISSQRAADLYESGVKLWRKEDLIDIEQQLGKSFTMEKFTVRRLDGSIVHIKNPIFGVLKPIWKPYVEFQEYWHHVRTTPQGPPEICHCTYFVDWDNQTPGNFQGPVENARPLFNTKQQQWEASKTCEAFTSKFRAVLQGDENAKRVTKVVCFGLGDLNPKLPYWRKIQNDALLKDEKESGTSVTHGALIHHAIALTMAKITRSCAKPGDGGVRLLTQDPGYSDETKDIVKEIGFEVVGEYGAGGFAEVDDECVVFSPFPRAPVKQIIADFALPLAIISCGDGSVWNGRGRPYADAESPRTRQMWERKDGLVLQPLASKGQRQTQPVRISYKNSALGPVLTSANNDGNGDGKSFEAFGIVGLLTVAQTSYLISITRREQVAQIHNHPIYVVTDVALTPLASQKDAEASVASTYASLSRNATSEQEDESDNSDDEAVLSGLHNDDVEDEDISTITPPPEQRLHKRATSVVNDVFAKKGGYGRFARNWFNRNGWAPDRKMAGVGLSSAGVDAESEAQKSTTSTPSIISAEDNTGEAKATDDGEESGLTDEHVAALLPKLLRTTSLLFGSSRSFYFSYDYDITRSVSNSKPDNGSDLPLHEEVDPLFFWNRNVIQPFIDAGQYPLVLPLLQGFVGQRSFSIERYPVAKRPDSGGEILELRDMHPNDERAAQQASDRPTTPRYVEGDCDVPGDKNPPEMSPTSGHDPRALAFEPTSTYLLTLISRRSVKRAGLRYLRRGIDEDGHCANSVETEQILSAPTWNTSPIYSFVQIRGSIPVFFSQSPYSFKPVPQMQNSEATNYEAFKKHFEILTERYGGVGITNLVEKHDNEAIVGDAYEKYWKRLNEEGGVNGQKPLFEWFDFHSVCRGMKFENVSLLLDSLSPSLETFGYTVSRGENTKTKQSGVLRTNCMDCLDRTNIVQSAVARQVLEQQLKAEGFDMSAQLDQTTQWFNVLWADNGDAVSKQYASTAAMKGDYTRTRKRDYRGALTDMGLSISRFYSGIVNDYFSQATIDFLVGSVSALIFEDFSTNLMTADPSVSLARTRQRGIEISHKLVVADTSEELLGGWAFLTPHEANTVKGHMEESVLLLTDAALYACRFDWNMEKVESFERVDLRHVTGVKWGPYVTATLTRAQCDERKNVGMVVKYRAGAHDITRVNTRSLSTVASREILDGVAAGEALDKEHAAGEKGGKQGEERIIALKALQARTAAVGDGGASAAPVSEEELVRSVAEEIGRVVGIEGRVEKGDIVGVGEAKRATGLLDLIGWRVKRLVWA
ncbi:hypothetical protein V494_05495 [Pseudogymnoascus sp. VKM F-4513 (FW-928)]|nr:hypothetical protein V494_05495 [Pseudogymnoascus sp. VKM F-4513 (FW-928)]